jgi:uncharacterized protein YndB with AHSA1/START domain
MLTVMMTLGRWLLVGMMLWATVCYSQPAQPPTERTRQDTQRSVINTVTIAGAPEVVFDLITTARFWPQWHPATQAVGGVTERPYGLNDRIYERGRVGSVHFQVIWKVIEYVRPSRVVLQAETSQARIIYSFQGQDERTTFTRRIEYQREGSSAAPSAPDELDRLMQVQSEQAVDQLKVLVERILREEAIQIP